MQRFLREIRKLAEDSNLRAFYKPDALLVGSRGLYFENVGPQIGRSSLFILPPPYHPLEALAAVMGAWPVYTGDPAEALVPAETRALRWGEWRKKIGAVTYYTSEQIALLYHVCTPLNTNAGPITASQTCAVFVAAGLRALDAYLAFTYRTNGAYMSYFWAGGTHPIQPPCVSPDEYLSWREQL